MQGQAGRSQCAGCGAWIRDGTAGCQAIFEEIGARAWADLRYARRQRMVVDTYCLQHPERYCVSAKSLAAHLTGLAWAFEYGEHPSVARAVLRFLDGNPSLQKPDLPASRGAMTIADVAASGPDGFAAAVEGWAHCTWDAYAALQPLARQWIEEALAGRRS
ncbi:MAG: DUF5946 family protein [Chloroflexota bacterium]|nr:DUF5946 family protein [Chloroflexota bacterium]